MHLGPCVNANTLCETAATVCEQEDEDEREASGVIAGRRAGGNELEWGGWKECD